MKITDVKVTVYEEAVRHPFRWREGLPGSGTSNINAWIEIETDDGITGKANVSHGRIAEDIVNRKLRELLIGRDPLLKEDLWERVWEIDRLEEMPIYFLGVADIADDDRVIFPGHCVPRTPILPCLKPRAAAATSPAAARGAAAPRVSGS